MLLLYGLLPVLITYLTKTVIDGVIAAANSDGDFRAISEALWLLGLMGALLLVGEVLQHANALVRAGHAEAFADFVADKIHAKASEVDFGFYESPEYHDLLEQTRGDASSRPISLLESIGSIIQNSISIIGLGFLLLVYAWWLPLTLILGAFPVFWVTMLFDRKYHAWWRGTAHDRRWTAYYDAMLTHPNSAADMRLFDLSTHFRTKYQAIRERLRHEKVSQLQKQGFGRVLATLIALATAIGTIAWMAGQVLYKKATLGDLGVFYQIFFRGQGSMSALLQSVGKALNSTLYLENLFAFLDLQPQIVAEGEPAADDLNLNKGIRFNSVSFSYPGSSTSVIDDLNLFIPSGTVAALVGVNGAGKSTVVKLLNRFYDPTAGSIEFDGICLRRFDPTRLRRNLSVLSQFPMQFHALAKENVALGDYRRSVNEVEIIEASIAAGAHGFIKKLPNEYETLLGKWFVDGTELSGGEWQRLALARAYFRKASVVILDEPTSFMDPWSEADWFERFREMINGQTGIVITHRFTIAMRADVIHVMDQGKIIESGTHRQLIESDGFYAASWKAQMQTAEERESQVGPCVCADRAYLQHEAEII